MSKNHDDFLRLVAGYVKDNPDVSARIGDFVQKGLNEALSLSREHASTMESIAIVLASRKFKGADALIIDKLKSVKGKTYFNWDWLTEKAKP